LLEQYWGRDLSAFDPDGPLPDVPPEVVESGVTRGAGFQFAKAEELTRAWREEAAEKGQSILEFARAKAGARRGTFTGSYDQVADRLVEFARLGAIDGLNITPWLIPSGLDDIVDELIPRLQERGVYPADYAGSTLREHLGLPALSPDPGRPPQSWPITAPHRPTLLRLTDDSGHGTAEDCPMDTTNTPDTANSRTACVGVFPAFQARDARAEIRFLCDVLGFVETLVVPG